MWRLKKIAQILGARKYKIVGDRWLMISCPFAAFTHADGDDKKFSFGMSLDGGFNCFTCGKKGSLIHLPFELEKITGKDYYALELFITQLKFDKKAVVKKIEEPKEVKFNLVGRPKEGTLNLSKRDILKWDICQEGRFILFPIYDQFKRCVGIKKRNGRDFFYDRGVNFKQAGIWYGEHLYWNKKVLFLVEGERDAIFLSRFYPCLASLGRPSYAQLAKLKRTDKTFILFFDNDKAGKSMKKEVMKELWANNKLYEVVDYAGCKDPAEIVEKGLIKKVLQKSNIKEVIL